MIIHVNVKLEFEVEYPLDMDFFEGDIKDAIAFEKSILERNPDLLTDLFGDKGVTTITIREVERSGDGAGVGEKDPPRSHT